MGRTDHSTKERPPRRFSTTLKQVAHSVMHGRKVTLHIFDGGETVTGYFAGIDDENFFLLIPDGQNFSRKLISRATVRIDLHDDSTFQDEPAHSLMEEIISPFRDYCEKNVLNDRTSRR